MLWSEQEKMRKHATRSFSQAFTPETWKMGRNESWKVKKIQKFEPCSGLGTLDLQHLFPLFYLNKETKWCILQFFYKVSTFYFSLLWIKYIIHLHVIDRDGFLLNFQLKFLVWLPEKNVFLYIWVWQNVLLRHCG